MTAAGEPSSTPIANATTGQLADALMDVVPSGLPIGEDDAPDLLVDLRSVYARAVVPSDRLSRLHALNDLLPRLIASLSDPTYREAIQTLFGLAPGTRGTGLMARRRQAAGILGYHPSHLRTEIEPKLITAVATAVHDDLLRYQSRVKRASESLEPTGDTPRLGPEHINEEEELVSRIWEHVYGLRAETIAVLRLSEHEGFDGQAEDHRQAALRHECELRELVAEYTETYGDDLVRHGDVEISTEALMRLSAWIP